MELGCRGTNFKVASFLLNVRILSKLYSRVQHQTHFNLTSHKIFSFTIKILTLSYRFFQIFYKLKLYLLIVETNIIANPQNIGILYPIL